MDLQRCSSLVSVIMLGLLSATDLYANTYSISCQRSPVIFEYDRARDFRCLCSAADAAIAFLASIGLKINDRVTIRLVDHIYSNVDHTLIGSYNPVTRDVLLLTYAKMSEPVEDRTLMSGGAMSEELWCSYAAHELAHVVSFEYLSPHITSHTAGEYISGVTQLSVLSACTRKKILDKYADTEAYHSREEMSELYFLMDPGRFAVKCYKHFISLENPKDFIEALVREGNGY